MGEAEAMIVTGNDTVAGLVSEIVETLCELAVWPNQQSRRDAATQAIAALNLFFRTVKIEREFRNAIVLRVAAGLIDGAGSRDVSAAGMFAAWGALGLLFDPRELPR